MKSAPSEAPISAEELFHRNLAWAAAIARNVARRLPDSFDPGDLLQEALIKMWEKAQAYKPANGRPGRDPSGTPFQAYAYLAVRGACLMSVRRRNWTEAKHRSLTDAGTGNEVAGRKTGAKNLLAAQHGAGAEAAPGRQLREPSSLADDPEQRLLARITRKKERDIASRRTRWIWKQVAKLSTDDAELMRQHYIDKVQPETIALLLGVDRAVVSRRLAGIVKRLKKARRT